MVFKDRTKGDKANTGLEVGVDEVIYIQIGNLWINLYTEKQVDKLIRKLKKYKKMAKYDV